VGELPRFLAAASAAVVDHLTTVRELPVASTAARPEEIRAWLQADYSLEHPHDTEEMIADLAEHLRGGTVHTTHPSYFGLFNPAPSSAGIAGELLAAGFNPQLAAWSHAPVAAEVEQHVLRFLARRLGVRTGPLAGNITVGGAEANSTALALALTRACPHHTERGVRGLDSQPVFYASAESHLAWLKIAQLAGLGRDAVRLIDVDRRLAMDVERTRATIAADRADGRSPLMIVATAGTTAAGVIDPLSELAELAAAEGIWLHVDAAWAGAVALSDRLRPFLAGIERADSVTVDAHKWLSAPMGAGMLVTPHGELLGQAFGVATGYMPDEVDGVADPYAISMQWSRRFAGLKILLSLGAIGRQGYSDQFERDVALGRLLAGGLRADGWEIVNTTPLPVVCVAHPGADPRWHARVAERIVASGEAWVSTVALAHRPAIRACVINYRTGAAEIEALIRRFSKARAAELAETY
jgi:aromatic-L-amino-acid decarboxylase